MAAPTEIAEDIAAPPTDLPVAAQADSQTEQPQVRAAAAGETLATGMSLLEIEDTAALPPHLSHDPQTNQKRSDPFQFGSRFLSQDDDPFEFNAWDHVETDDAYKEYSEQQYEMQRQSPVSDMDKCTLTICSLCACNLTPPPLQQAQVMIYLA